MLALFYSFILLFAESGFQRFYDEYLDIPGFEVWKFINLAIFVYLIYLWRRRPLSERFKARREAIRADLIRAEQEKQAALERLTSVEANLAELESERARLLKAAEEEAAADSARLVEQTELEIARLRQQTSGEIGRLTHQVSAELRRFAADESVRRAEEKLRSRIDADADSRLVRASIQEIGALN